MRLLAGVYFVLGTLFSMGVGCTVSEQPETALTGITLSVILYTAGILASRAPLHAPAKGRLARGAGYVMIALGVLAVVSSVEDVLFDLETPVHAVYGVAFLLLFGLPGYLLVRLGWRNAELEDELEEIRAQRHSSAGQSPDQ